MSENRSLFDIIKNPSVLSEEGKGAGSGPAPTVIKSDSFFERLSVARERDQNLATNPGSNDTVRHTPKGNDLTKFLEKVRGMGNCPTKNPQKKITTSPSQIQIPIGAGGESLTPSTPSNRQPIQEQKINVKPPTPRPILENQVKCPSCGGGMKMPKEGWTSSCRCGKTFSYEQLSV